MSACKLTLPLVAGRWYRQRNGELYLAVEVTADGFALSRTQKDRDPQGRWDTFKESPQDLVADAEQAPWSGPVENARPRAPGTGHVYGPQHHLAHILHAIADGVGVQCRIRQVPGAEWGTPVNPLSTFATNSRTHLLEWRITPSTIRIGDFDVPEPLRGAPPGGTRCYEFDIGLVVPVFPLCWDNRNQHHRLMLARGLLHSTEAAARLHAKALLSLSRPEGHA